MWRLSVADCVDILTKCAAVIKDLIRGGICLLSAVGNKKFLYLYEKKLLTTAYYNENDNDNISTDFTNDNKNYAKSLISSGLSWIFGNKWQRFHRILKQEIKQGATCLQMSCKTSLKKFSVVSDNSHFSDNDNISTDFTNKQKIKTQKVKYRIIDAWTIRASYMLESRNMYIIQDACILYRIKDHRYMHHTHMHQHQGSLIYASNF